MHMSSSQTEHLGLHRWEGTDTFSREEINENFELVDAGVNAAEEKAAGALAAYKSTNDKALSDAQAAQAAALNAYKTANDKALAEGLSAQAAALEAYKSGNDTALAQSVRRVKLKETVITEATKAISIDISDVDWNGYRRLEVEIAPKCTVDLNIALYYNDRDETTKVYTRTDMFNTVTGWCAAYLYPTNTRTTPYRWNIECLDGAAYSEVITYTAVPVYCAAVVSPVTKLGMYVTSSGNGTLLPGTKATVWGVK